MQRIHSIKKKSIYIGKTKYMIYTQRIWNNYCAVNASAETWNVSVYIFKTKDVLYFSVYHRLKYIIGLKLRTIYRRKQLPYLNCHCWKIEICHLIYSRTSVFFSCEILFKLIMFSPHFPSTNATFHNHTFITLVSTQQYQHNTQLPTCQWHIYSLPFKYTDFVLEFPIIFESDKQWLF